MGLRICGNNTYRDMTPEEEKEWLENHSKTEEAIEVNNETALKNFFTGLASGETTTIAKIRQLAKDFLEKSEG